MAVFEQLAVDINLPSLLERLQEIERIWQYQIPADHPIKRSMLAAGVFHAYWLLRAFVVSTSGVYVHWKNTLHGAVGEDVL